jgi:hypothetical protein
MQNVKDVASTVCGLLFVICGAVLGTASQITLPKWAVTASVVVMAISGAVSMYLTGKRPDGTAKSPEEIAEINSRP